MTAADTRVAVEAPAPTPAPRGRERRRTPRPGHTAKHLQSNLTAYVMIAPMAVLLGIFVFWPLVYAFWLSGHAINFYLGNKWVGTQFYRYVLTDHGFWQAIKTGLLYSLMVVPTGMVVALVLAMFLKTLKGRLAGVMKTVIYMPAALSSVIAAIIFAFMGQDSGLWNAAIGVLGFNPVPWLNSPHFALPAVAVAGVWLGLGVSTLILLSALLDIPESYYESASLDGANFFKQTWYITIPLLRNVLLYLLVTGFTLTIQEFQLPLIMTGGGPVGATETPNLFIFDSFRENTPYATSYSLAAALLLFIVLGAISLLIFRVLRSEKAIDA